MTNWGMGGDDKVGHGGKERGAGSGVWGGYDEVGCGSILIDRQSVV